MMRRLLWLAGAALVLAALGTVRAQNPNDSLAIYRCELRCGDLAAGELGPRGFGEPSGGTATALAIVDGNRLIITGEYSGLSGTVTEDLASGVHLHHDPAMYHLDTLVRGFRNDGGMAGAFAGTVILTPDYRAMLEAGRMYLDIHTTALPDGELRGMLTPIDVAGLLAR